MNWYWHKLAVKMHKLKHFSVNLHEFWVKNFSNSGVGWWYCISRQSVQDRQPHYSLVHYATGYIRHFCGKGQKTVANLIKVKWILKIHTCYRCKSSLLSFPTTTLFLTSATIFVNNGAFYIACSVRNVLGYTLLHDVKLACNKHSDITS